MAWWREAKFGMFVHWGVYSTTGGEFRGKMPTNSAEWMMNKARIPIAGYKVENVDKFNPTQFDAKTLAGRSRLGGLHAHQWQLGLQKIGYSLQIDRDHDS